MALENATYVNQLVPSNPTSTDSVAQADDHMRLIKSTLVNTFPNLSGQVTATAAALSLVTETNQISTGMILIWSGSLGAIPSGWALCDGTNGTPDLRDRFVVGAGNLYARNAVGGSKDAIVPAHTHTATSTFVGSPMANHSHTITDPGHTHSLTSYNSGGVTGASTYTASGVTGAPSYTTSSLSATTGISVNAGSAGTPTGAVTTVVASSGTSVTDANLPPYYALAYIMKL